MSSLEIFLRVLGYLAVIWAPGKRCELKQFLFSIRYCRYGNAVKDVDLNFDPNDWLKANRHIAANVVWLKFGRILQPWSQWSSAQRRDLTDAYFRARIDALHDIPDAPEEAAPQTVGAPGSTFYPEALAWRIYTSHLGTLIAGEQGGWLLWAVRTLSPEQRASLLDARHFFDQWNFGLRYVSGWEQSGPITLSDPTKVLRYLRQNGLVRATRRETVSAMVEWGRRNMLHYGETRGFPNDVGDLNEQHWQYRGDPPQIRVLEGTTRTTDGQFSHWTHACHGTAALVKATLRLLGIPVLDIHPCQEHATIQFPTEGWYLGHGDTPYDRTVDSTRPIDELFMGESEFEALLGPQVDYNLRCVNIDRHAASLGLSHPTSNFLLEKYCIDLTAGVTHANGEVARIFSPFFSLAELEAANLWSRLDAALAARGGCANIP